MRKSEIFENFVKIAKEKGMISEDAPEKAKKKLENNPRMDSLDISAIEALYGVKPDMPKSMEYKNNIMENAHPNSMVISPSYDKINGLVENNIERQNIILNIVNKTPNGQITNHKYAKKDLLLSLVRIANDLDNKNQDKLRTLADACLEQISNKPLRKQAIAPLVIGAWVAAAAIIGGLYWKQHSAFISDGFEKDHEKLVEEIDDLLQSNDDWGVGYKYKPQFTQTVEELKNHVNSVYSAYKNLVPVIAKLQKPRDAKELMEEAKKPESNEVAMQLDLFKNLVGKVIPFFETIIKNFQNESYKQMQIADKGWMSSLMDKTQILHGGKGFVADDFDDVRHAIETYYSDIKNVAKILGEANSMKEKFENDLKEAAYKNQSLWQDTKSKSEAPASSGNSSEDESILEKAERQAKELGFG